MNRPSSAFDRLLDLVRSGGVMVLSGAGLSTESGIPDYRGLTGKSRASAPIQHREFVSNVDARTRYWARSAVGWPHVKRAQPNRGHEAVATLEASGLVSGVVTQNVDGLHQAAGSSNIVELHGSLHRVTCLECSAVFSRDQIQRTILRTNHGWDLLAARKSPDGDSVLPQRLIDTFLRPVCPACNGELKPDVIFFGDSVPADLVERACTVLERARILLVLGSSLTVYSGFRFAERAARQGKPVAVVNIGPTRADSIAQLKLEEPLGETLSTVCRRLTLEPGHPVRRL